MNAIDTNVLVYSLDRNEPTKQAKAKALLAGLVRALPPTVLLWQVCGELLNWLGKWEAAGQITAADAEAHFNDFLAMFPVSTPTQNAFSQYFALRTRFSLSHWDAMLLAACKAAGVTNLYSEDMQDGMNYDGVTVTNPFT
jgi:predicted nucleic acid-binding protein